MTEEQNLRYIIQTTNDLLLKRKAIRDLKTVTLLPQFDSLKKEITEIEEFSFNVSMTRMGNELEKEFCTLDNLNSENLPFFRSYQLIEEELNRWMNTPELKEKHQDLFEALNTVKENHKLLFEISENPDRMENANISNEEIIQDHNKFQMKLENILSDRAVRQEIFAGWRESVTKEEHIHTYIDHQNTLEQSTKNSYLELIDKKQQIEKKFNWFKFKSTSISFFCSVIAFTLTASLAIAAIFSVLSPLPG